MFHRAIAFALLVACGLGFLLYPQAESWYTKQKEQKIAFSATISAQHSLTENDQIIADAVTYNQNLARFSARSVDPDAAEKDTAYQAALQFGTLAMAELYIPKIAADLPIYHGTGEWELQHGAGHLYGTSLPVGGASTHTVITAHAGIPGNELFTRLPELELGDEFTIITGPARLTYQVTNIQTVLPNDVEVLAIAEGKDLATLVTCTPIGINSHRLLVTGERVAQAHTPTTPPGWQVPSWAVIFGGGVLGAFLGGLVLFRSAKPMKAQTVSATPIAAEVPHGIE